VALGQRDRRAAERHPADSLAPSGYPAGRRACQGAGGRQTNLLHAQPGTVGQLLWHPGAQLCT